MTKGDEIRGLVREIKVDVKSKENANTRSKENANVKK